MNFKEFNSKTNQLPSTQQEWKNCLKVLKEQKVDNPIRLNSKGTIDTDFSIKDSSFMEVMTNINKLKEEEFEDWGNYKKTLKECGIENNIELDENGKIKSVGMKESDFNIEDDFDEERRLMEEIVADLKLKKPSTSETDDNDIESFLGNSDFKVETDEIKNFREEQENERDNFSLKETIHNIGKFSNENSDDEDYTMYSNESEEEEKHFAEERSKSDTNSWNFIKSKFKNTRYV